MTETWQWFLTIGGGIIFLANVIYASSKLIKYIQHGKQSADGHFEKKVKKIIDVIIETEVEKSNINKEIEHTSLRNFFTVEIEKVKEAVYEVKSLIKHLQHATLTDLKIKLRTMYYESFEVKGMLSKFEKSNWDRWFSDYSHLDGNSDIKTMNDHVQKVHLELTIEKQKAKAKTNKKVGTQT